MVYRFWINRFHVSKIKKTKATIINLGIKTVKMCFFTHKVTAQA